MSNAKSVCQTCRGDGMVALPLGIQGPDRGECPDCAKPTAAPAHTPEPWDHMPPLGEGLDAVLSKHVNEGGNFYVAQCNVGADAARIVACVNALAGMEPAALPALIEAAENAERLLASYETLPPSDADVLAALRAALAGVRGTR